MLWIYLQSFMWVQRGTLMVKFPEPNADGLSETMGKVKQVQWQDDKVIVLVKHMKDDDYEYLMQFAA